jgi:hypothetical protein
MNIAKQFDELMANLRAHYPLQARQFEEKMSRVHKKAIEELRTFDGKDGYTWAPVGEQILEELKRYYSRRALTIVKPPANARIW